MNKKAAKKVATAAEHTWGDLKAMIQRAKTKVGFSSVNPSIPIGRAVEIYEAAIADRPSDLRPIPYRPDPYSRVGRMQPTGDFLTVTNILRDCG